MLGFIGPRLLLPLMETDGFVGTSRGKNCFVRSGRDGVNLLAMGERLLMNEIAGREVVPEEGIKMEFI